MSPKHPPSTNAPPSHLLWKPLGKRAPDRWRHIKQSVKSFSRHQKQFVKALEEIARSGTIEQVQEGLAALDTVPRDEELRADLVPLRFQLLSKMGQHHLAYGVIFDQLFAFESELLWLDRGALVREWLDAYPAPTDAPLQRAREGMIHKLDELCQQTALMVPRLLLSHALSQGQERPPERAQSLLYDVLDASRWKPYEASIGPWTEALAGGFFACIEGLLRRHQRDRAEWLGRQILAFGWQRSSGLTPNALHLLCLALLQLDMLREQKLLCERVQKQHPGWGEPTFWLGRQALQAGQGRQATHHFHKALQSHEMSDTQLRSIARGLLQLGQLGPARDALAQLQQRDSVDVLQLEAQLALYREDLPAALEHCEAILAQEPDDRLAALYRVSILVSLGRLDDAEQRLLPWCDEADLSLQLFAHLLLGDIRLQQDQPEAAREHFEQLLAPPLAYDQLLDPNWQRGFLLSLAESLERTGDTDGAIARYQDALAMQPSTALIDRILWLLLQSGRQDEAASFASSLDDQLDVAIGSDVAPEDAAQPHTSSPWYQYAMLQIAESQAEWERCLALLDDVGWSWIEAQGLMPSALASYLRALLATRAPWKAVLFCENHLDLVLQTPRLRLLRQRAMDATEQHFAAMQETLGQQALELQALDQLRASLEAELDEGRSREQNYQQILQQHRELQREKRTLLWTTPLAPAIAADAPAHSWGASGDSRELDAPAPTWQQQQPELFARLPKNTRAILYSAALLWDRMTPERESDIPEDYAPIVLQLSRVVESEVNRLLIDPLVAVALDSGFSLSDFPLVKSSHLQAEKNRISVSDAAYLLYHTLERQEPDGSISTERNPRSQERHKAILEAFWSHDNSRGWSAQQRRYIQHQLPLDLQALARYRNPASHASADQPPPLPRETAEEVQRLTIGALEQPGILQQLSVKRRGS